MSPNVKKDRRKFGLKKKKSTKGGSVDLTMTFNRNTVVLDADSTSPLSVKKLALEKNCLIHFGFIEQFSNRHFQRDTVKF